MSFTDPTWAGPCLLVPMTPEALLIGEPNQREATWASTAHAYEALPYGAPDPVPFSTNGGTPETGVHLTWTLPSGLRSGSQAATGDVSFMPAPNRWLVIRFYVSKPGAVPVLSAWVIESDTLGAGNSPTWPALDQPAGFTTIGKATPLGSWKPVKAPSPWFLQAVAPGNVAFASTYRNVVNVFALHDPLTDAPQGSYAYAVLGWFSEPTVDPLWGKDKQPLADEATWDGLMDALRFTLLTGLGPAEAAWQSWRAANPVTGGPALNETQARLPSQILCHAFIHSIGWTGSQTNYPLRTTDPKTPVPELAIGANVAEALSAWIAHDTSINLGKASEQLLLAFQSGVVNDFRTDPLSFSFTTHTNSFGLKTFGDHWVVARPEDQASPDHAPSGSQSLPLNPDQTAGLTKLNALELERSRLNQIIASLRQELFFALWKQINWTPFAGIPQTMLSAWVAVLNDPGNGLLPAALQAKQSLNSAIDTARQALEAALTTTDPKTSYLLSKTTAPRGADPMDPVVLIGGGGTDTKLAHPGSFEGDSDGAARVTGQTVSGIILQVGSKSVTVDAAALAGAGATLALGAGVPKETADFITECLLLDPTNAPWLAALASTTKATAALRARQVLPFSGEALALASPAVLGEAAGLIGTPPSSIAVEPWLSPWTPLFMDWQVSWRPTATTPAQALDGWALADVDFVRNGASPAAALSLSGRTTLTPNQSLNLTAAITDFLAVPANYRGLLDMDIDTLNKAVALLKNVDVLSQSLGGFDDQLVQRLTLSSTLSGAANAAATAGAETFVPNAVAGGFFPIRGGDLTIERLWLVDAFGQVMKVVDTNLNPQPIVARAMQAQDDQGKPIPGVARLPPRLVQPARLDAHLVSASNDQVRSNASDLTSPIAGWLLPNHLDNSLTVFDAEGNNLGALITVLNDAGMAVRWDAVPGSAAALGAPPAIANRHLSGLVDGIRLIESGQGQAKALAALLDTIDVTLWKTDPMNESPTGNLSVLVGRPMAVVRMLVRAELLGLPHSRQNWASSGRNETDGFPGVPLPVRLGDLGLVNNGVVGYYAGDRYDRFHAAYRFAPGLGQLRRSFASRAPDLDRQLAAAVTGLGEAPPEAGGFVQINSLVSVPPDGKTVIPITAIVDPRGSIPVISGWQPLKTLALPPGPVSRALQAMFVTFRMGPLLTDPEEMTMPLPASVDGTWSWIERSGVSVWRENTAITAARDTPVLKAEPPTLREGWLKLGGAFGGKPKPGGQ